MPKNKHHRLYEISVENLFQPDEFVDGACRSRTDDTRIKSVSIGRALRPVLQKIFKRKKVSIPAEEYSPFDSIDVPRGPND